MPDQNLPAAVRYGAGGTPCCGLDQYGPERACAECPLPFDEARLGRAVDELRWWRASEYYTDDFAARITRKFSTVEITEAGRRLNASRL